MSQLGSSSYPSQGEDSPEIRRKRVLFRCWHRGTQESDLILGSFADSCLGGFGQEQLERFEALLDCSDVDLFDWIIGGSAAPIEHDHDVLCLLRAFWAQRHGRPRQNGQPYTATTT